MDRRLDDIRRIGVVAVSLAVVVLAASALARPIGEADLGAARRPSLGGVCKTCAEGVAAPDFTPSFPPVGTFAFHSSSLSAPADCNWYAFAVQPGHRYEFRTCSPGSATFDTVLEAFDAACASLAGSDDARGCGRASAMTVVAPVGAASIFVRVSASGGAFGTYTLAYREQECPSCPMPLATLDPAPTCQYVRDCFADGPGGCLEAWYVVNLVAGGTYVFTTCPTGSGAMCPLANATPATFDTEIFLHAQGDCSPGSPLASSTGAASCSTAPTHRAHVTFVAPTSDQYLLRLSGPGGSGSNRFGCFNLGYMQLGPPCRDCMNGPFLATLSPTTTCQVVSGNLSACQDEWYLVSVSAASGGNLEFSTCTRFGGCLGGSAAFDSRISLYTGACVLVAEDDDGCGRPGSLLETGPLAPGLYKLLVQGAGTGAYVLTYRATPGPACAAPSNMRLVPTMGRAPVGSCGRSETFLVTADGTASVTYAWSITAPPGGVAIPPSGIVTGASSPGNPAAFVATLLGMGDYSVTIMATNACSPVPPSTTTFTYSLLDRTPPVLTIPADTMVECDRVPPPVAQVADNCDPAPRLDFSETRVAGPCAETYRLLRSWTATDASGNVAGPATQGLSVRDVRAPRIVPDTRCVHCLYPPNHAMACFATSDFQPVIVDNCSGAIAWTFAIASNSEEPLGACGPGDLDPDWTISPDGLTVCVRSERCGNDSSRDDGRVYTILATATDACGNVSDPAPIGAILVPHDDADTSDCIVP